MSEQYVDRVVLPWNMSLHDPFVEFTSNDSEESPGDSVSAGMEVVDVNLLGVSPYIHYRLYIEDGKEIENFSNGAIVGSVSGDTAYFDKLSRNSDPQTFFLAAAKNEIAMYDDEIKLSTKKHKNDKLQAKIGGLVSLAALSTTIANYFDSKLGDENFSSSADALINVYVTSIGIAAAMFAAVTAIEGRRHGKRAINATHKKATLQKFCEMVRNNGLEISKNDRLKNKLVETGRRTIGLESIDE